MSQVPSTAAAAEFRNLRWRQASSKPFSDSLPECPRNMCKSPSLPSWRLGGEAFNIFQHLSASFSRSADVSAGSEKWPSPFHPHGLSSFSTAFGWFWCSSEDHIRLAFVQEFPQWLEAGSESPAFFSHRARAFTGQSYLYSSIGCKLIILQKVKKCKKNQFVISYTITC